MLFIGPGTLVYAGMVIGEYTRGEDLEVNITREKKLTNMRSSTGDELVKLTPPTVLNLEQALEFCATDECVEVTPESVRVRKVELDSHSRARQRSRARNRPADPSRRCGWPSDTVRGPTDAGWDGVGVWLRSSWLLVMLLVAACTNEPVQPPPPPADPDAAAGADPARGRRRRLRRRASTRTCSRTSRPVTTALATLVLPSVFRPDADGSLQLDPTIATSAEVVATEPFTVSYELNLEASWSDERADRRRGLRLPLGADAQRAGRRRRRRLPADHRGALAGRRQGRRRGVLRSPTRPGGTCSPTCCPRTCSRTPPVPGSGALTGGLPASGGPFRIATVDRARGEVVLARNDLYWDTPAVLDQLVLRRLGRRRRWPPAWPPATSTWRSRRPSLPSAPRSAGSSLRPALQQAPQPIVTELGMRADGGPLGDARVRRGIALLLDREAIRAAVAPEALPADAFGLAPSAAGIRGDAPRRTRRRAPIPPPRPQLLAERGLEPRTSPPAGGRSRERRCRS